MKGYFFYPLLKIRSSEVTSDYDIFIINSQGDFIQTDRRKYDISGFSAGVELGNKWVIQDKFTVTVFGEAARNLGGNLEDENADLGNVEPRLGINFGYRF
ncbi:MAG: hypothetical protein ABF274_12640 [Nonlabens sp.]|uniref:hypothetical protein n=1 Tax=Nonlabens sp. TaxID=1888209 RepID=UPI0032190B95